MRIQYLRQQNKHQPNARGIPIACIVSTVDRENDCILYAVSIAHRKDSFEKKMGRKIALGRLEGHPHVIKGVPTTTHEINKLVMADINQNEKIKRVRTLTERWLTKANEPKAAV